MKERTPEDDVWVLSDDHQSMVHCDDAIEAHSVLQEGDHITWQQLYDRGYQYFGSEGAYCYFHGNSKRVQCLWVSGKYVVKSITPKP